MEDKRPRIIDVLRKPVKCPVCGERVVDIIYGTGDLSHQGRLEMVRHYEVEVTTEMGEKEVLSVTGVTATDAVAEAKELVANGRVGLKGCVCQSANQYC